VTRLLLVRHGETAWNREKRLQGWHDVPLSDLGRRQAVALARYLVACPVGRVDRVYASPLSRALDTAKVVAEECGLDVNTMEDLREIHVGSLAGMTWAEVEARLPGFREAIKKDPTATAYPDGESMLDVVVRARGIVSRMARDNDEETVLLVGHAVILKAVICLILGLDIEYRNRFTLENASLSVAELRSADPVRGKISRLNDTHYLEGVADVQRGAEE
jgi:broad specificity phosphatase PhoE